MSSISGLGSTSSAWANTATARSSSRGDRLFNKVDADGSGSVDTSELQTMLDKIAKVTGTTAASAADVMKKADTNGDGSLSKAELGDAMKSLFPADSSTVDFAQRSQSADSSSSSGDTSKADDLFAKLDTNGDGTVSKAEFEAGKAKMEGAHKMHGGGHPPPPSDDSTSSTSSTSSTTSTSTDPLDTNGDGVVSASERAAGDLKNLLSDLAQASQDTSAASSTASSSSSSSSDQSASDGTKSNVDFAALTKALLQQYQQAASTTADSLGSSLSLTA